MRKLKLTIVSVFAAILIVAGWGVSNNMRADVGSHNVSGEMYQSDGESCINPKVIITGTSQSLFVNTRGQFSGQVSHLRTLTFSADGCESVESDPITSDISNWEVELPVSGSSQTVKFKVSLQMNE